MRLNGKNAIVTGGSRGIGRAIALALAENGANVALTYKDNRDGAEEVVDQIKQMGRTARAIQVDVSRTNELRELVDTATDFFGEIHILVNNAGILNLCPFLDITEKEFDHMIAVNLRGPFFLTQLVGRKMAIYGKGGSIVNISSISAERAKGNTSHYDCAKAGLSMLTKSTALELAPYRIRVNALCPGLTRTNLSCKMPADEERLRKEWLPSIPLGRFGQPIDHAMAVVFLASDEASWITGVSITIDGGNTIR